MSKKYIKEWEQRLNPKRFRRTSVRDVPRGWNPFDSDFSRVVMSAPFRRLQDKAQVFPLEPNDFVRTRLTHSIEVSSVARSLGVRVENWLLEKGHLGEEKRGHIPSILAVSSLVHDIGNPPFGHFGEQCVKDFFRESEDLLLDLDEKEQADLLNFDGNVQGFRLLLKLGLASDEFSYNLTFPTLATVVKYPKDSKEGNKGKEGTISFKKYGFYQVEAGKYKEINDTLGLLNERHPLCFFLEAADDICYSVSDIEDGFNKKTLSLEYLLNTLDERFRDDQECNDLYKLILKKKEEYKERKNDVSLIVQDCRVFSQIKMINSAIESFQTSHDKIISGEITGELLENSPSGQLRKFFDDIAVKNFNHKDVIKSELIGETVISYLLKKLTKAALSSNWNVSKTVDGKLYSLISYQAKYAKERTEYKNDKYLKLLMVIDFVSGMTDSYALSLYKELNGIK